jgi:hypothetical protein
MLAARNVLLTRRPPAPSGPATLVDFGSNRLLNTTTITTSVDVAVSTNCRIFSFFADSHGNWHSWTTYDTFTVESNNGGALSMVNVGGTPAVRDVTNSTTQYSGQISLWELVTPNVGAHTITGTIVDSGIGASSAQMHMYTFVVENCSGVSGLVLAGTTAATSTSFSIGPVSSATDNLVFFGSAHSQNPTLTGGATQLYEDGSAQAGFADWMLIASSSGAASVGPVTGTQSSAAWSGIGIDIDKA